jgi:hypothetical protein
MALISMIIALCALSVTFCNVYLSRFPHVSVKFLSAYESGPEFPYGESMFIMEVESWGLPIWDMKVYLEIESGDGIAGYGRSKIQPETLGTLPNPMNAGQVAKFRCLGSKPTSFDWMDKPENALRRFSVAIYGSGDREIKRYSADKFESAFMRFDRNRETARLAKLKATGN